MQIAQTDVLRLIDDDSVRVRNVKAVLYDGCTQQHIIVACHKVENSVLQNLCLHLTMRDADFHVRNEPVQDVVDRLEFLHLVVKEENLPSTVNLVVYDLADFIAVKEHYFSLHRNPVRRRR